MTVGLARPSRLSSGVSQDNVYFTCHSTNRPLPPMGGVRNRRVNLVLLLVHLSTDAAQALVS